MSKNADAVALGRLGGLKGGPARMAALTPEERTALARSAAQARWRVQPEQIPSLTAITMRRKCVECGRRFGEHRDRDDACPLGAGFSEKQTFVWEAFS